MDNKFIRISTLHFILLSLVIIITVNAIKTIGKTIGLRNDLRERYHAVIFFRDRYWDALCFYSLGKEEALGYAGCFLEFDPGLRNKYQKLCEALAKYDTLKARYDENLQFLSMNELVDKGYEARNAAIYSCHRFEEFFEDCNPDPKAMESIHFRIGEVRTDFSRLEGSIDEYKVFRNLVRFTRMAKLLGFPRKFPE